MLSRLTSTSCLVSLSSGHKTLTFAVSPTDFARSFKKIYSTSNRGASSTLIELKVQPLINPFIALTTSFRFCSLPSVASKSTFCSFTRNGLYFIVSPVEGNCKVYVGFSSLGNAIIFHLLYYNDYNFLKTAGILLLNCLSTVLTNTSPILSSNGLGNSASSVKFFQYLYAHVTGNTDIEFVAP